MTKNLKPLISIITVVYNNEKYIHNAIESVLLGSHPEIEYIIIDGGSTDNTCSIIENYLENVDIFVSEPDKGIYDAMNKGVHLSTGEYIAFINSDGYYCEGILKEVVSNIKEMSPDILYGNIDYINNDFLVKRRWISGKYNSDKLRGLWIPPHPSVFMKKSLFNKINGFNQSYKLASDYDLLLRALRKAKNIFYFDKIIVKMRLGGVTNATSKNILKQNYEILNAYHQCFGSYPIAPFVLKIFRRLMQLFYAKFSR